MNIAVLIPAYNPETKLLDLLQDLCRTEIARIIVVDDGSESGCAGIFTQAAEMHKVELLVHPENQGKGAALKTGFQYLRGLAEPAAGVVTADADGQHTANDILHVCEQTLAHPTTLVLGGRRFDRNVPWKSMYGNTITRWVLRLFFGIWLYDSQTGLRGIPAQLIPFFMAIPYNRYEYEMEMLLVCRRCGIPMKEVEIETVYFDQNKGSHFKPWQDAARIYSMLFRYGITWLGVWLVDWLVFALGSQFIQSVFGLTLVARVAGLACGFILIRSLLFQSKTDAEAYFQRFAALGLALGLLSAILVPVLQNGLALALLPTKLLVEGVILASVWLLQNVHKRWILQKRVRNGGSLWT